MFTVLASLILETLEEHILSFASLYNSNVRNNSIIIIKDKLYDVIYQCMHEPIIRLDPREKRFYHIIMNT